ncbi:MAG: hypothetical protein KDB22_27995 [Planctomycetales bacterium]|nr:hypothetical protein [Planctomycetales bacterium]
MVRERGFRGWTAAITVGVTLTLIFLAVEKHVQIPPKTYFVASQTVSEFGASTQAPGILLTVDPGLAGTEQFPPTDQTPIHRRQPLSDKESVVDYLRRPPQPAADVTLFTPQSVDEIAIIPDKVETEVQQLMSAMDQALQRPVRPVAAARQSTAPSNQATAPSNQALNVDRLSELPTPSMITGRIPEPKQLMQDLQLIEAAVAPSVARMSPANAKDSSYYVSLSPFSELDPQEASYVYQWSVGVQQVLHRVVHEHGLEHPASHDEMQLLAAAAAQAATLGNSLTNYALAAQLIRAGYALERRVAVWQAIQGCLDNTSIALSNSHGTHLTREELLLAIERVERRLEQTADHDAWREYLLLDELKSWVESPQDIWTEGNQLAYRVLTRLRWQRLTSTQREFLQQEEFQALGEHLASWSREPVDYRQLLIDLEDLESDDQAKSTRSVAGAVQVLRTSTVAQQQQVAGALNDHYRNANIRLNISRNMIQRFLPEEEIEVRPVRRRILEADTKGDSAIHTALDIKFLPDPQGWHIDVGIVGDMYTNTASFKGPATFHNSSTAQITSHRYIRLDPHGYQVSSEPTMVNSQDYLRNMSTTYDGLPIVGDFVRLIAREQFDQKRGLAKRISQRIIANETDAEVDRRLAESLRKAERELTDRIVGPLERLNLNPMVVSMDTTSERLSIRYRVASEDQMASHTPRPRAPAESILSMQIHQSAINNTIDKLGLSGKTWTLEELYRRLGEVFQQKAWQLPPDAPSNITIRFADSHPAFVELVDGKLRLSLRILELRVGEEHPIHRFIVTSTYTPLAEGMHAELIRDSIVEIQTSHRFDRIAARVVFTKIFLERPEISLISEKWSDDERAKELAVSQVEIRDGWLAVAISPAGSEMATQMADRSRELKSQF